MTKYFRALRGNKVLEPKAKGSYPPEADKVPSRARDSYNQEYFEHTTLGLTGNLITNILRKSIYRLSSPVRALMIGLLLKPKTVLDVGCGKGNLVLWLRKLGIEAYGADISSYALENAHKSIKRYLRKGEISSLPFENNQFDLVVTFDLLEHICEEGLPQAIKECQRVAGRWVLHKIYGTTRFEQRFPVKDPTHVTIRRNYWWRKLFAKLELKSPPKFFPKWEGGIFFLAKECYN